MKLAHRTDIDGLRGVAVLAVLFFHAYPAIFPGGYIGVDIFFVLSGFLISATFFTGFKNFRASIASFYIKRFKRIAPAAVFVILVTWLIGLKIMLPDELKDFSQSLYSTIAINSHGWAKASVNYFGISTQFKPLIHYWSLTIEILFYLLFPVFGAVAVIALNKNVFNRFFTVFYLLLIAISFYFVETHVNAAYFSFLPRLWEFFLGTCVYFFAAEWKKRLSSRAQLGFHITGLVFIVASVFALSSLSNFPGPAALLPTLGAAWILAFETGSGYKNILRSSPLVFVGKISYSLYLVHQPVFAFFRVLRDRELVGLENVYAILVAFLTAYVLWRFIEKPAPDPKSWRNRIVYGLTPVTALALMYFANLGATEKLSVSTPSQVMSNILKYREDNNPKQGCRAEAMIKPQEVCVYHPEKKEQVALWGDSHSDQIALPLADNLAPHGYAMAQFSVAGCPPIVGIKTTQVPRECEKNAHIILNYLLSRDDIKIVILHAYWIGYFEDKVIAVSNSRSFFNKNFESEITAQLKKTVAPLVAKGKKVVLIKSVPRMPVNPPFYLARYRKNNPDTERTIQISEEEFKKDTIITNRILDDVCESTGITCVEIAKYLYNNEAKAYIANKNDILFYRDDNHISLTGAKIVMPSLVDDALAIVNREKLSP